MKRNTIKWRIFQYNLSVIIILIALVTIIFNVTVRMYIEKEILAQLTKISSRTEDIALRKGPDFFPKNKNAPMPEPPPPHKDKDENEVLRFYFMLDRSLREPLSVINADYILLDRNKKVIAPSQEEFYNASDELLGKVTEEINKSKDLSKQSYLSFSLSGTRYVAIVKPVSHKNDFGLGWIIIYSSLQKVNQLQIGINLILFSILIFLALVIVVFSSIIARKITAPFASLNEHVRAIAERNFGTKVETPVYGELQELVNNFNIMSEKLETYDKAQKTFLQNASHEFRTPLMSIQSYAEGIKYEVMDSSAAADIIIDESKRMTRLVEELLYLSRLDTIEENYSFNRLDFNELVHTCIDRIDAIAKKEGIMIEASISEENIVLYGDEEKLSRAVTNVIGNCIRYAAGIVKVRLNKLDSDRLELIISDDGPGFDPDELPNVFERFYKGKKGVFGLGLAISKNVIERHNGAITAGNSEAGALFRIELPISKEK